MSTAIVAQQMCVIMILVAIGFYLCKKQVIDKITSQKISAIVMDVCNPAMILASILSGKVEASHEELIEAIVVGFTFYLVLVVLGILMPIILRADKSQKRFYNVMTVYTNIGFIGIPVARAILPPKAIIYVVICNVMYALLFYTHGIVTLSNGQQKMSPKKIFSPGTIMAVVALLVCWFNYTPPVIISSSVTHIGNATVFLSMALLGASIARSNVAAGLLELRIWAFIALRLVLFPVAVFLILRAAGCDDIMGLGFSLMAMMPIGNLPLIQSEKMGEDTTLLSKAIAVTTLLSMFTITVLMILFTRI
ncbi:MAG: hypothetical protein E7271_00270 [Lachnospiraceae bacterium]|jgi:predicted permease|nr:hypothetical protein [Lachnospiraceae bacterium]